MSDQLNQSSTDAMQKSDPEKVIDATAVDAEKPAKKAPERKKAAAVERPYPRRTLEDAMKVPTAIKTGNNGNDFIRVDKVIGDINGALQVAVVFLDQFGRLSNEFMN